MFWKELSRSEKHHLKEQEITTLRDFKQLAEKQAKMRSKHPDIEPCCVCKEIARKLGFIK